MMSPTERNAARRPWPRSSWAIVVVGINLIAALAFAGDNSDGPAKEVEPVATTGDDRPNVVVIVSDDHRADLFDGGVDVEETRGTRQRRQTES